MNALFNMFKRFIQKVGRWLLFRKDEDEDNEMAIGRSNMSQQVSSPGTDSKKEARPPARPPFKPKPKNKPPSARSPEARRAKNKRK